MAVPRLADLDLAALKPAQGYFPSPSAWEDQVLYFLLIDRFSNGREKGYRNNQGNLVTTGTTPPYDADTDRGNAVKTPADAAKWREAGGNYVGGSLKGLTSKIGYLRRMGVTAVWISPVFKQVAFQQSYHGYGIQDFLEVNPRFGTPRDLKELTRVAHANGIYVILDIILNHAGDIFGYDPDRIPRYTDANGNFDPRWDGNPYTVSGYRDANGHDSLPFLHTDSDAPATWPGRDEAVWPIEFQNPAYYTQKGRIDNWEHDPEYRDGDFFSLKDIHHGFGAVDNYVPSQALLDLCTVYKYWIAFADIDGYRIDTVKHMDPGATRFFASEMHEFAQSLGKDDFYLIGEITGGRTFAFLLMEETGLNAALGIDDIPDKMEYLVKGFRNPSEYFSLFRNSLLIGKDSHVWFRNKVVTVLDDHDQIRKKEDKGRFCADPGAERQAVSVLALNTLTLGIPCLYYGTEQAFDGHGSGFGADRYIRETMFGGEFGAFASRKRHFFNEDHPVYKALAEILALRRSRVALRRGRQYLREISGDGVHFGLPQMVNGQIRYIVPWSRILSGKEMVLAINTDPDNSHTTWVTIDSSLHKPGTLFTCLYSTAPAQKGATTAAEPRNGLAISVTVPAAGFVIYE